MKVMLTPQSQHTITCPACSLLCDDVLPDENRCPKARSFFSQASIASPQIKGKNVSLEAAIAAILNGFKMAKMQHIGGLGTDVEGFRAVYQFAQQTGVSLSHMHHAVAQRNMRVLQSTGWQTTTLTEVKNRADVLLFIGCDIAAHHPRFFERIVCAEYAMFTDPAARKLVFLGGNFPANFPTELCNGFLQNAPEILPCATNDLAAVLATLNALLLGKPVQSTTVAGLTMTQLQALVTTLKNAQYAVFSWVAKDLNSAHAELTIAQMMHIINTLNKTTRAAGLPLGSADGETGVQYAHTWLNGRILNGLKVPIFGTTAIEQANVKTDALLWIDSFNSGLPLPKTAGQTFVLGNPNLTFNTPPDVFIPIATPGLDCVGTLFRADGAVSLPLQKTRASGLPTLAEVLAKLL